MDETNKSDWTESIAERKKQLELSLRIYSASDSRDSADGIIRPLLVAEVETLIGHCGCQCRDWSQIRLLVPLSDNDKDQSLILKELISNTTFHGRVLLGITTAQTKQTNNKNNTTDLLPYGIHNNGCISNSIIENMTTSKVIGNSTISHTHVHSDVILCHCGMVSSSSSKFVDELTITVGPEAGGDGRPIRMTPESTMLDVAAQIQLSPGAPKLQQQQPIQKIIPMNILSQHSTLIHVTTLENVYLYPHASIIGGGTTIHNAILFPHAKIINGSNVVSNAFLQWNAKIEGHVNIQDTIMMEQSSCGPHNHIVHSILGPDVHVSNGEIHHSVLGPNMNAHHQSLVISFVSLQGRGNIGYGSNIGSNHTGRLPDQENIVGEGIFWGLSSVIKYPIDMSLAPYSVIAAGVQLSPQKCSLPFSLIVASSDGNQNRIQPGWVLLASPYTIARSEKKYATRQKAKRHKFYTVFPIMRSQMIQMCYYARYQLSQLQQQRQSGAKDERSFAGILGANILTDKHLKLGIRAYTECIQRYVLNALYSMFQNQFQAKKEGLSKFVQFITNEVGKKKSSSTTTNTVIELSVPCPVSSQEDILVGMNTQTASGLWDFSLMLLLEEFPLTAANGNNIPLWLITIFQTFLKLQKDYTNQIFRSKQKDELRGSQIISSYKQAHTLVEQDPVIVQAKKTYQELQSSIQQDILVPLQQQKFQLLLPQSSKL